jgi:poly(A) polymerase
MIAKFLDRLLRRGPRPKSNQSGAILIAHKVHKKTHRIDPSLLSKHAVKVTHTLQQAGYTAYIVGGAVRDLVLGIAPKDFDVATNATPEQVQKLFRRSRLIGRRFQIVHVTFFGKERPEIIEVSTFRAVLESVGEHVAESGRILRDNVWGTHAEDAARRDFTMNAMYYDPSSETVLDYHGGMEDIRSKTIRMIGNPTKRYREDPIRMLRAIRFAAKTGFQIEPKTLAPIHELGELIHDVPSARLFDELLKLFMSGHAWSGIQALRDAGLHHGLLPFIDNALKNDKTAQFIQQALRNTDDRIQLGKSVSPGFLFAALLWPDLEQRWRIFIADGMPTLPALHAAIDDIVARQNIGIPIQRRHEGDMRDIWTMQPRFDKRVGRYPYRLLEVPRFRAGYDFMLLLSQTGYCKASLGQWWTDFYHADLPEREALLAAAKAEALESGLPPENPNKRRRRRPKKTNKGTEIDPEPVMPEAKQN